MGNMQLKIAFSPKENFSSNEEINGDAYRCLCPSDLKAVMLDGI